MQLEQEGDTWLAAAPQLLPQDYDTTQTFVVKDAAGNEIYSGSFSVLSYLGQCLNKNIGAEDMQSLLKAMYHYYAAAEAFAA